MSTTRYDYYNDHGCGAFSRFVKAFSEFDIEEFAKFVAARNKGDRDEGELADIAMHEVLRLAAEWCEIGWRFALDNDS